MENQFEFIITASKTSYFSNHNTYINENDILKSLLFYNAWLYKYIDYKDDDNANLINEALLYENDDLINKSLFCDTEEESKIIIENISDDKLKKSIEHAVSITRGIIREKQNLKSSNIIKHVDKLYKKELLTIRYKNNIYKIIVCGRIDGLENNILIEAKNRRNHFFDYIPIYEKVQIEMYLYLLNIDKCKQIQYHNKLNKIIEYNRDEKFFDIICSQLITYFTHLIDKYNIS
ncbi:putative exonuclease RNase T and DNA polymerase III [Alphaentomopoxvirus acuprea]|uniref:Putative exonuclease RNase T and DNA polymerase III n=1 Tax=Alphaentomopoxvirus acuprea TaxID=62099 RepID=W6JJ39_9POXV|nr:putative exonuclease RNase T and DNA polymerase III [Anomala cuprea entomopoxvirus]YP_009001720.1 putative exonuclease RNase T and DNA polymerase III [Anomala cuprea entomopoxvirus]BAO49377.1 putative exonuclease RNase T and DNA polymerase III [Anomala cuprea entomopoxvirus]BAO49607.1 putative exonuclease RNase T and DNA polymerase III [Anomala cuprea entomopoxvirus]